MSDYKPITGELRDTLKRGKCIFTNSAGFEQVNVVKDALDSMLDAIDAVHAGLERENERLRRELDERPIAVGPDALEAMARLEHSVELPKDVDGEYICEHDTVDWRDHSGTWHENASVVGICAEGCYVMYALDGMVVHVHKSDIRHHHPDTWERIIDDAELLARDWFNANNDMSSNEHGRRIDALVARCKALCERTKVGDTE